MVTTVEVSVGQTPLLTITRYIVVSIKFRYGFELDVFAIADQVTPLSIELSHCVIDPLKPTSVNVPAFAPPQTVASE